MVATYNFGSVYPNLKSNRRGRELLHFSLFLMDRLNETN